MRCARAVQCEIGRYQIQKKKEARSGGVSFSCRDIDGQHFVG
jgi:hypothetical protein